MHNIKFSSYHCSVSKKQIEKRLDAFVAREDYMEGATGLPSPIRWITNVVCSNETEATEYIQAHDKGWYDCLAVRYKKGRKIFWLVKIEYHT